MNKKLILLRQQDTDLTVRIQTALEEYFSAEVIESSDIVPSTITSQDVVVALLDRDPKAKESGGFSLDQTAALEACGLDDAFKHQTVVIPILLGHSSMPAAETLPDSVRPLAYKHALPIRGGPDLPRDLGRLVRDLEVHLKRSETQLYPWDLWLLPIGFTGAVLTMPFLFLGLLDALYWNYAYETVARYREARWILEVIGPLLFGVSLLVLGIGFQLRRYRFYLARRAEFFHTGAGQPPLPPSVLAETSRSLAFSSAGFGAWAAIPAIALGGFALFKQRHKAPAMHSSVKSFVLVLLLGVVFSAWGFWRTHVMDNLQSCLAAYERGVVELEAGQLSDAEGSFLMAVERWPTFGHVYQRLAAVNARRQELEKAEKYVTQAIEIYPEGARGTFAPDQHPIAEAYRNRAQLRRRLGQPELAEQDEQKASEVDPWLDIFGGFLRGW